MDFEDCCFEGPVVIRDYRFEQGSNLLGRQGQPTIVHFDVAPERVGNVGPLDLDRRLVDEIKRRP